MVLGLTWQDIDFSDGTVVVRRSVDTRNRRVKPDTKTSSSRRTIPLDADTLTLLRAMYSELIRSKLKPINIRDHADHDFKLPVRDDSVRRTLNRALKKAGLPHIRVHDLRHTAGSLLVAAGVPMPTVADFLGHSSPATTASVYAHAIIDKFYKK
jgi:integrase